MRGRGRRPPVYPRALLVESNAACGDLLDVALRDAGVWAMQVLSASEAERLLEHMAFELVVVDAATASEAPARGGVARAVQAAGCGPVLALTRAATHDAAQVAVLGARAELSKPFTTQALAARVSALGVGMPATLAGVTELAG